MNLSEYRSRVARVIGMSTSNTADLSLIDNWVNEGVLQFLKDTKLNVLEAQMSVTASQADYTLDSNILTLTDIWYAPSGNQSVMLDPIDSRDLLERRLTASVAGTNPYCYALSGAWLLMLYPAPMSSLDKLHLLYVPRPSATISNTADSPADATRGNIPAEFHPVIEAYVKWKAGSAEEHKNSQMGMVFQAEYEQGIKRTRSDLNRKAGVFMPRKKWGTARSFPITPGTDIRGYG